MKVIENFLPKHYQDLIEKTLLSDEFPWYLSKNTYGDGYDLNPYKDNLTLEGQQFIHLFSDHDRVFSNFNSLVSPIHYYLALREGIDITHGARIKANLNPKEADYPTACYRSAHEDAVLPNEKYITAIYYVNDSDGDTIFFETPNKKVKKLKEIARVTPKKGTLVYFNGNTLHAGQPPRTTPYRCLININFNRVV